MDIVKKEILERRVLSRVEREIAEANEKLLAAGRVNPDSLEYKRYKAILRYSYDRNMSLPEARAAWMAIERQCGRRINDLETLQKTQ